MRVFAFATLAASLSVGIEAAATSQTKVYCTPGQSCWPTDAQWNAFSTSIGGRLIKVRPWGDPCYTNPNGFVLAQCDQVRLSYDTADLRNNAVGQMQADNWAYCNTTKAFIGDCSLDASAAGMVNQLPEPGTCGLGRLSPYAVNVSNEDDVSKTYAFAAQHNIKLVIKNTGHEYQGRSSGLNTLMMWTHNLQSISYAANYNGTGKDAVIMGAGVTATQAYLFAATKNRVITLGAYGSVGVAGGFAQGGGHGPLGPKYGLAVDNIIEYTVVTPDGKTRKANSNSNSDLFWAMRGGGGGTWGLATQTIIQVFPDTGLVAVVYNLTTIPTLTYAQKLAAVADFIAHMALYQPSWTKLGWAGYNFFTSSTITFSQFLPDASNVTAATASMQGMITYMETNKNFIITGQAITPFPTFEPGRTIFFTAGAYNTPVAFAARLFGRLIPYQSFNTTKQQQQLGRDVTTALAINENNQGVIQASENQYRAGDSLQIYSTGAKPKDFGGPSGNDTGVNTAWRSSLWEVVVDSAWTKKMSQASRNNLAKQTSFAGNVLRKYGTGCYYSESDVLEPNWQQAFFGDNYNKLVAIKKIYDPNNVLVVYKGIGYEGQENQANFACYQQA